MNTINTFIPKGKKVRDAVHGDIFIPKDFLDIIDTPEFQRLRRIKQLSVANEVFPSADHTRFSHSLGAFYIMQLLINHFEDILLKMDIKINEEDKNVALLAALLHDIGHGPFSHAFENIHPEKEKNINHESWTVKIITDIDGNISNLINKNFGKGIDRKVADLILKQRKAKNDIKQFDIKEIDLFSILTSLISSQLDADRMDYLLRDSMHAGVMFGDIDIERLITSLHVTVYDNNYYVCIPEKFLHDIEAYVLARYQMQKAVYYHDFKIQMERIIEKIFRRAFELNKETKLEYCPGAINEFFKSEDLCVKDYIRLDDSTFVYAFQEWTNSGDELLSELCRSFLYREKANKIKTQDNKNPILETLKRDVIRILNKYDYETDSLEKEYFWIEQLKDFSAYKKHKENIWIERVNGLIEDLSNVSKIIKSEKIDDEEEQEIWKDNNITVYINYNIIRKLNIVKVEELIKELKEIIDNYDVRKNIEIEKKYIVRDEGVFEIIKKYIDNQVAYKRYNEDNFKQVDIYYDTVKKDLYEKDYTLRLRNKNEEYEITIKKPINCQDGGQSQRFEFKRDSVTASLKNHWAFIKENFQFLNSIDDLKEELIISNSRELILLENNNVKDIKFEIAFDRVEYENFNGEKKKDFQIEIELKSDYPHRVNLKKLTDDMEKNIPDLEESSVSKYIRGLDILNEINF